MNQVMSGLDPNRLLRESGQTAKSTSGMPKLDERHIQRLWDRMTTIFGYRWTAQYGEDDPATKNLWLIGLADMQPIQIKFGINRLAAEWQNPFPPSLPEFRALCQPKPEDLGLPDLDHAYRDAINCAAMIANGGDTSRFPEIVQIAVREIGSAAFREMKPTDSLRAFSRAYEILTRKIMAGEKLEVPKALEKMETPPAPPEVALSHLAQIKAQLRAQA